MKLFENKMEKVQNSLIKEKEDRTAEIKKTNDLLAKEIEDKKKLESQLKKTNDLLAKEIEDKKKLEEQVKKLNESNESLFNEIQIMKKKDLADENYQYIKNLNIELLKEGIAFNDKHLALYKGENDLENLKIELVKRDLKIKYLEGLKIVYEKDLQVKEIKLGKLKLEIEGLKKSSK